MSLVAFCPILFEKFTSAGDFIIAGLKIRPENGVNDLGAIFL